LRKLVDTCNMSQIKMESKIEIQEEKKNYPEDTQEMFPRRKKRNKITHFP